MNFPKPGRGVLKENCLLLERRRLFAVGVGAFLNCFLRTPCQERTEVIE